jgi:hypothetical protein
VSVVAISNPSAAQPGSAPDPLARWLAQLPLGPTSNYLESLSQQLRQRPDLVWPLHQKDGRATQFALADGGTLSVTIDIESRNASFRLKYPPLDGNRAVAFELLIEGSPQGSPNVLIRTNATVMPPIIGLKSAELRVEDGVLKVNGQDLRTLFRVPFNRETADAGSKLRVPEANVALPTQLQGRQLEWDTQAGFNSVWLRVDGQLVDLRGMLRQNEKGALVIWQPGKSVTPLEEATLSAVQAVPNLR